MRDELRRLPGGVHRGTFTIDTDGIEPDREFVVHASVETTDDGGIRIDFADTLAPSARPDQRVRTRGRSPA